MPHGDGAAYCRRGSLEYQGEWQQGLRHGHGEEYASNGELIYSGEWQFGQRHGDGKEFCNGNLVYQGEWSNGLKNGWGEEYYPDGSLLYVGSWHNGLSLEAEAIYLPDGTKLPLPQGYVYLWSLNRGNSPERALSFWQRTAQSLEPHVTAVTDNPREQAILYSLVELSSNYTRWDEEGNYFARRLGRSLEEILRLPPLVINKFIEEGVKVRFTVGMPCEEPNVDSSFKHLGFANQFSPGDAHRAKQGLGELLNANCQLALNPD